MVQILTAMRAYADALQATPKIRENAQGTLESKSGNGKEIDMCSETILRAAPTVREVHLYSSGNTAVLRSWVYSPGLRSLSNVRINGYP